MSSTPATPSFAKHFAFYALANVLTLAAGLVSFPITTRLLSSAEFGLLSYWESGLLVLVAILKLGASDGAMRFYPHGRDPQEMQRYATNILLAPALMGLAGWTVAMFGACLAWLGGWLEHPGVVVLALLQVLPLAWGALAFRVLQARELASVNAVLSVIWRWLTVASTLGVLIWITQTAFGVLAGKLLIHILVIGGLLVWLLPSLPFSRQAWDWTQIRAGMHYGLPLAFMELSNIALWYLDRFMMKWLLNDFAVIGIYSIGFALASYIDQLINTALGQALTPVINRVFVTEGPDAVRAVKRRVMRPLVFACFAIATGLFMVGTDFLTILASADKAEAAPVFQIAGAFFLAKAIAWSAAEGLLLHKRSKTVFVLTIVTALLNAAANLVLIPRFGMMGAVYATGCALVGLQVLFFLFCPKELRVLPQASVVIKATLAGALCLWVSHETALFGVANHFARMGAATLLIGTAFAAAMATDAEMRAAGLALWRKVNKR